MSTLIDDPRVRLTRTVPSQYVHRAALAEVLLTDWQPAGEHRFLVRAQWPRAHSLYAPLAGQRHDPLLFAETVRQVGLLLSHAAYRVPLDHSFLMRDLRYSIDPDGAMVGTGPTDWELEVTCLDRVERGGRLGGMAYRVTLLREGVRVGHGGAGFTCAAPRLYERLRGPRGLVSVLAPRPARRALPEEHVRATGRAAAGDVVLEAGRAAVRGCCGWIRPTPSCSTTPSTTCPACCSSRRHARPPPRPPDCRAATRPGSRGASCATSSSASGASCTPPCRTAARTGPPPSRSRRYNATPASSRRASCWPTERRP